MEPKQFCQSCAIPVAENKNQPYCDYCSDEKGDLKAREEIKMGIAGWLKTISPDEASADYQKRAESYMNAMPAWAN